MGKDLLSARNTFLIVAVAAAAALLFIALPVFSTDGDHGVESGASAQGQGQQRGQGHATAPPLPTDCPTCDLPGAPVHTTTPIPPSPTPTPAATATPLPPTPTPTDVYEPIVPTKQIKD